MTSVRERNQVLPSKVIGKRPQRPLKVSHALSPESPRTDRMITYKSVRKRSVKIKGHQTSFSLEDRFWDQLKLIAKKKNISISDLVEFIDENRKGNLSSALRVYILEKTIEHKTDSND